MSEDGAVVEAREHEPTLERAQETRLGHQGNVLGVRQVHVGISDSVDHAPVGTQGTTSKFAHVHGDYDGQACFDRSLGLLPYLLATLTYIRRSSPPSHQPGRSKHLSELAGRSAEQSEQVIRGEILANPVDYLAVCPMTVSVVFVVDGFIETVRVEPVIVKESCHGRLAALVPVHPRPRAVIRVQIVDAALWVRLYDLPHAWSRVM